MVSLMNFASSSTPFQPPLAGISTLNGLQMGQNKFFAIKSTFLVTALKPDIVVFNDQTKEVIVFELTCPWDSNISRSHAFKSEKYSSLIADLSHCHSVSFFSVEVSARGQITKENRNRLKAFLFKSCSSIKEIHRSVNLVSSKAALLSPYSIFAARGEPTWENPVPLVVRYQRSSTDFTFPFCLFYYFQFIGLFFFFNVFLPVIIVVVLITLDDDLYQALFAQTGFKST